MVDIQSKEIIDKISDELKIQPALVIPREISKNIQLTYNVNAKGRTLFKAGRNSATGNLTIFTTDSNKNTVINSAFVSITSNATSNNTNVSIQVTEAETGALVTVIEIRNQTLTAGSDFMSISFPNPIKLERNSAVILIGAFSAGASTKAGGVTITESDPQ